MKKPIIVWAFMSLTALAALAYQPYTEAQLDSVESTFDSVNLNEVVITASRIIHKPDKKIYIPRTETKRTSTDGLDMIKKMQMPRISVNQVIGQINIVGPGVLALYINGVRATDAEIHALRPDEIVRVECHDTPSPRYGDATMVIDVITRHTTQGGNLSADLFECAGKRNSAFMNELSGSYHNGKSSWSVLAQMQHLHRGNWLRNYDEEWHYPAYSINRTERGKDVSVGNTVVTSLISYTMTDSLNIFHASLGLDYNRVPGKEEGDRNTILHTSNSDVIKNIYEHTTEKSFSPSINLYYKRVLSASQSLIFDIVGTYIHSDNTHLYEESNAMEILNRDNSVVKGDKYSLIGEGVYRMDFEHGRLLAGIRHSQSDTKIIYHTDNSYHVGATRAESTVYGDYVHDLEFMDLGASVACHRFQSSIGGKNMTHISVIPALSIGTSVKNFSAKYHVSMETRNPNIADMSDVVQTIQPDLVTTGNPNLKCWQNLTQELTALFTHKIFEISATVNHSYEHKPVMGETVFRDRTFVKTFNNQKSFSHLSASATLTVRPWKEHISVALTPLFEYFDSKGNAYHHTHTMRRLKVDVDISFGNWTLTYNTMIGPANSMRGEEIIEERNMGLLTFGYMQPKWYVQLGCFNPFYKNYWMKSINLSALTPSTGTAWSRNDQYAVVKVGFNLNFGKGRKLFEKSIHNQDTDTGILDNLK